MKTAAVLVFFVAALAYLSGCDLLKKGKETPPPPETQPVKIEPMVPVLPPPPEVKEVKKEPETLVSKEDIEKSAKIYNLLHNEDIKNKVKKEKVAKLLEEFEWSLEKYEQIIFDIGRDPESAKIYTDLQEKGK